ncbi:MAG: gliding motility-associated C-terminal domain-containing protein [Bacteroidota bacterium]
MKTHSLIQSFTYKLLYWLAVGLLLPILSLQAQTLTNSGQLIYVSPQTIITIEGGVQNTGSFINNGSLAVSGNWENQGSYHGRGTLVLNGNEPQQVKHSKPGSEQSFYVLQLAGKGEKTLTSDARVDSALILDEGLLTPVAGSRLLLEEKVKIDGGSVASYINGAMAHRGLGYKLFPIGKQGQYCPVVLDQINGVDPVVSFEAFIQRPPALPCEEVLKVSPARFWQKQVLSGTFDGALITLGLDANDQIEDLNSAIIVEATDENSLFCSLGKEAITGNASEGTITSHLRIAGNLFAVGVANLEMASKSILYIPNAFSPNATNPEEQVWKVYSKSMAADGLLLRIYNRWGNLLYESQSMAAITQTGWDGRSASTGKLESQGVYTYTLKGKLTSGQAFEKVGIINLMQ